MPKFAVSMSPVDGSVSSRSANTKTHASIPQIKPGPWMSLDAKISGHGHITEKLHRKNPFETGHEKKKVSNPNKKSESVKSYCTERPSNTTVVPPCASTSHRSIRRPRKHSISSIRSEPVSSNPTRFPSTAGSSHRGSRRIKFDASTNFFSTPRSSRGTHNVDFSRMGSLLTAGLVTENTSESLGPDCLSDTISSWASTHTNQEGALASTHVNQEGALANTHANQEGALLPPSSLVEVISHHDGDCNSKQGRILVVNYKEATYKVRMIDGSTEIVSAHQVKNALPLVHVANGASMPVAVGRNSCC